MLTEPLSRSLGFDKVHNGRCWICLPHNSCAKTNVVEQKSFEQLCQWMNPASHWQEAWLMKVFVTQCAEVSVFDCVIWKGSVCKQLTIYVFSGWALLWQRVWCLHLNGFCQVTWHRMLFLRDASCRITKDCFQFYISSKASKQPFSTPKLPKIGIISWLLRHKCLTFWYVKSV